MKSDHYRYGILAGVGAWGLWCCLVSAGTALAQVPFYQDKTITVVAATDAGGTADLRIRTVVERVIKNLPREPEVVELFKNLFGAGPLPPR